MSRNELMQQDRDSRESIVTETGVNFFVEAGAGSGKTTMLVRRMVAMVEAGIDVGRICAITFTKAAAGEFYERFQELLAKRSIAPSDAQRVREPGELGNPTDITRERCLKALQNIDLCFMGTIDSFCAMALSEHPAEAGVPSDAVNITDYAKDVYVREYTNLGRGDYGEELKLQDVNFRQAVGNRAKDAFREGVDTVAERRHTEIMLPDSPEAVTEKLMGEKEELTAFLGILAGHQEAAYYNAKADHEAWGDLRENLKTLRGVWKEDLGGVIKALKKIESIRVNKEWIDNHGDLLGQHADYLVAHYSRNKLSLYKMDTDRIDAVRLKLINAQYAQSMEFLIQASDRIAEACRKRGELTYFDYLLYLRDMLKKDAEGDGKLIRHIYNRHSYFLIDEFQDTNPLQAEIFFYLTAEKPVADWRACVPRPGSLFIVGDPKQSIYRFRSADVAAFLKVKAMFTGEVGRVLYLTRNFRSTYRLRKWFNNTFADMLSVETEEQSRFEEIPLEEEPADDGTFNGVYSYDVLSGKDAPEDRKDPAVVAGIIRRLVGNPAYLLPVGKGELKTVRPIQYRDFMLITPTKSKLAEYMQTFTDAGIPFYVEGKTVFKDCPALVETVKLFDAFAKPGDRHALYKALTGKTLHFHRNRIAKCCNMSYTDEDGGKHGFSLNVFSDNSAFRADKGYAEAEPLQETLRELGKLTKQAGSMTSSALFRKVLDSYPVLKKAGADNLEYLWFALELLRAGELDGTVASLREGSKFLNDLIGGQSAPERCLSLKTETDRVHLANLHKVKGLEAPIVILGYPSKRDMNPEIRTEQGEQKAKTWIFSVSNPDNSNDKYFSTDAFSAELQRELDSMGQEKLRLLYVAATRAKNVLFVGNPVKQTSGNYNPWQRFLDAAEGRWEDLPEGTPEPVPERETVSVAGLYEDAPVKGLKTGSVKKTYTVIRPSAVKVKGKSESEEEYLEEETDDSGDIFETPDDNEDWSGNTEVTEPVAEAKTGKKHAKGRPDAAVVGTMTHRVMEALVSSGNRAEAEALIRETVDEYGYEFPEHRDEYMAILRGVINTVRAGGYPQESDVPQDILSELLEADEVCCEVPFAVREEAGSAGFTITNGIIDVLYRKGAKWHIIDYKTNAETEGLSERYEPQLRAYIRAVKAVTGCDADAKIYHIEV